MIGLYRSRTQGLQASKVLYRLIKENEKTKEKKSKELQRLVLEEIKASFALCYEPKEKIVSQENNSLVEASRFFDDMISKVDSSDVDERSFGLTEIKHFLQELKEEGKHESCSQVITGIIDSFLETWDSLEHRSEDVSQQKITNWPSRPTNLYIIGNGFDLKHQIPSRYSDFALFCHNHHPNIFFLMNELYPRLNAEGLWSDFEDALEFPNNEKLMHRKKRKKEIEKQNGQEKDDSIGVEPSFLKDAFNSWTYTLNSLTKNLTIQKRFDFNDEDYFITFNYTTVLEDVYKIDPNKVLHIHEKATDPNYVGCIYGHGGKNSSEYPDEQSIKEYINDFKKEYQCKRLMEFINMISPRRIIVLGHSMAPVDQPYFEILSSYFPKTEWSIHYLGKRDLINKTRNISDLKINYTLVCDD